jgi:hemoglobin-like flavoprotein
METDIHTLRSSFQRVIPRADRVAERFYDTLFERYPETRALFEGVRFDDQKRRLMRALALVVRHMEHPDFLRAYLQGLGAIHKAYGVAPEHYPAFAECMLSALAEAAGASWRPEEDEAWRSAIRLISDAMLTGADRVA